MSDDNVIHGDFTRLFSDEEIALARSRCGITGPVAAESVTFEPAVLERIFQRIEHEQRMRQKAERELAELKRKYGN